MIGEPYPRAACLFLALISMIGCVSLQPARRVPDAEAVVLSGVPATEFGVETCGAASLSAVLAYWGLDLPIDELDRRLPKADNGGVLSLDLVLAARELGFEAEMVDGDRDLIETSLEAGVPLILMLRVLDALGESRDLHHYVIVDGFDRSAELVRVQYGDGTFRWVSLQRLARSWDDTGFATLVIRPDGAPGDLDRAIAYGVALEEQGRLPEAAAIYRQLLERAPESALLWVNLGNVEAAGGRRSEAESCYQRALELDPDRTEALNNLAWLLLESRSDLERAHDLASRAVSLGGPDPYLSWDTLGRIELALGRCDAAGRALRAALGLAPDGSTAAGWILHGLALSQRDCGQIDAAVATLERALDGCLDPELCRRLRRERDVLSSP